MSRRKVREAGRSQNKGMSVDTDGNARCTWGTGGASESHQWGGGGTGEGHRAGRDEGSTDHAVESKCVL